MDSRYKVPSRTFFSDTVIPELYRDVVSGLKEELATAMCGVSLTTDMWRSHQNREYMCVTFHWTNQVNNQFIRRQALVSLKEFPEATTAVNIQEHLNEVMAEWLPPRKKLLFSVSDNGANIKRCLIDAADGDFSLGWVPCAAHCLNLTTRNSLDQQAVKDSLKAVRTLVSKVKNSHPVKRRFEELLNLHYPDQPHRPLVKDVDTRWNSTLDMVKSVLKYRDAAESLANDRIMIGFQDFQRPRVFSHWSQVFDLLNGVIDALQPSKEATLMVSSDDSSLADYIPLIKGFSKQLSQLSASPNHAVNVGSLLDDLREKWRTRMDWVASPTPGEDEDERELNEQVILRMFHVSTVFDPR
ncbi:zinc finger BED domain-containing protein 6-like [Lytechinus variegatus]|uniref:zinc finger BED domain-containing protein 6-like n=1 Tax=Lytechinus variegatus TaxID=7654 RepID=UPI001BB0ECAC|nr:zinc finger BED domain-containing protein 6-like [Lytechinus variegatus]